MTRTVQCTVIGCKLKQNANVGCNSCASLAGLRLSAAIAPRPPTTVANPYVDRSLGSKETHIQSHNPSTTLVTMWCQSLQSSEVLMSSIGLTLSFKHVHELSRYFRLRRPLRSLSCLLGLPPDLPHSWCGGKTRRLQENRKISLITTLKQLISFPCQFSYKIYVTQSYSQIKKYDGCVA